MSFGPFEIALIFLVILLLFGAKRIPEIARGLGKGIREFKDATSDIKKELTVHDTPPPLPPQAPYNQAYGQQQPYAPQQPYGQAPSHGQPPAQVQSPSYSQQSGGYAPPSAPVQTPVPPSYAPPAPATPPPAAPPAEGPPAN